MDTHTKSIELNNLAHDNGVILLCFPKYCTRRLKPLDVDLMKPLLFLLKLNCTKKLCYNKHIKCRKNRNYRSITRCK